MSIKPATHKTVHTTVHKTTHKTTHTTAKTHAKTVAAAQKKVVAAQKALVAARSGVTTASRVGCITTSGITTSGLLLNDRLTTCALLAWWNACVSEFGDYVPTPDDALVASVYASLEGDGDGLYLEHVLERATHGLFGYRLLEHGDVPIGSAGDHAYGGDEALEVDLGNVWWVGIEPI